MKGDGKESYVCAYSKDIFDFAKEMRVGGEGAGIISSMRLQRDEKFSEEK